MIRRNGNASYTGGGRPLTTPLLVICITRHAEGFLSGQFLEIAERTRGLGVAVIRRIIFSTSDRCGLGEPRA